MSDNLVETIQQLIDNPLKPNPSEWAMACEEVIDEVGDSDLKERAYVHIDNIQTHNGAFPQHNNSLIGLLKRAQKKIVPVITPPPIKHRNQVFVAMKFDGERERLYEEVLTPCVRDHNYCIVKVNDQEFEGSIMSKIVENINDSSIIIVDLTGNRGGVYYEAGIAKGLQLCGHPIQIILTCEGRFFDGGNGIHFDLRGDNIIVYESDDDYSAKLNKRLDAICVKMQ